MSIQRAIDRAIDLGSQRILLSAKQFHVFSRSRQLQKKHGFKVFYRSARIDQWGKK